MMRLYGVQHGGEYTFGGFPMGTMAVSPAEELLEAIEDLPARSTVGIEYINPDQLESEENVLEIRDEDKEYWQTIVNQCLASGHYVAYLDSYDIHLRAARKRAELIQLKGKLGSGKYEVAPGQERTVAEISFGLEAEVDYLHAIAREDHILRELEKFRPELAVIGLAHSDYLMLNPELAAKLGVSGYWKGLNDAQELPIGILAIEDRPVRVDQYLEQSPPDPATMNEREFIIRTHNAASLGRIMLGTEAQWIGSWQPDNRPYGLFEVFPRSGTEGRIEDRLGTAEYSGEFEEDRIEFTKRYLSSTVYAPGVVMEDINYEAFRSDDGEYHGTWISYGVSGEFIIRHGIHLFDPVDTNYGQQKLF